MRSIIDSHHAIFREGDITQTIAFFRKELERGGMKLAGNPDVIFLQFQAFGIGEARELIGIALSAPVKEEKKIIVLSFDSITREAQNATLKLFEDPSPSVEFLIAGENADALLPTLRSRLFILPRSRTSGNFPKSDFGGNNLKKFLSLSVGEKLKEAEKMLKKYKDDGDKKPIREFLRAIHLELEKNPKQNAQALRASAKSISYMDDKSASMKLLLESVVLSL